MYLEMILHVSRNDFTYIVTLRNFRFLKPVFGDEI